MAAAPGLSPAPPRRRPPPATVVWLIVLTALPELALLGADAGLWGSARWRPLAYQYGAFWGGLLGNWKPNYPVQPAAMFLTYALLHGGFWHLLGNMTMLALLGPAVVRQAGQAGFLAIYAASAVGGAAAFGLIGPEAQPMVGASGALFGLAGALGFRDWRRRRDGGLPMGPVRRMLAELAAINLVMWLLLGGLLAWQTHLGGFLAGWAGAAAWARIREG